MATDWKLYEAEALSHKMATDFEAEALRHKMATDFIYIYIDMLGAHLQEPAHCLPTRRVPSLAEGPASGR